MSHNPGSSYYIGLIQKSEVIQGHVIEVKMHIVVIVFKVLEDSQNMNGWTCENKK